MFQISYQNYQFVELLIGKPRRMLTIQAYHEAAHAIAAYRYRIPYHFVRVVIDDRGMPGGGHLAPDTTAIQLAVQQLDAGGHSLNNHRRAFGCMIKIAKLVNIEINRVHPHDAGYFSQSDDQNYNQLAGQLPDAERTALLDTVLDWRTELARMPLFATALGSLAQELTNKRQMTDFEVAANISASVGDALLIAPVAELAHATVNTTAGELWLKRDKKPNDDWADWFTAERSHRYVSTLLAMPPG